MQRNKPVMTKMAAALSRAVHERIQQGYNTGNVGRVVLTNEAKGTGIYIRNRRGTK